MRVLVHGGAGGTPADPEPRQAVLDEAAVAVLEDDPQFNAGVGGAVQSDGRVRTDAGVMTADRRIGAACSMEGVANAVSAARVVLEETPHVLVSGDHAVDLAADSGVDTGVELLTDDRREAYEDADPPEGSPRDHLDWMRERFGGFDTVGAVAVRDGDVAAATSTGGRLYALAGRVGDVPQAGSGFYAAPAGGASATGDGEDISRVTLTRRAVQFLEGGMGAQSAADAALDEFEDVTGATAGLIVLDADGRTGAAFNSADMQTAAATR
ncbi:MAG: isoaspartyl peptidase/L-asparaginase [Halobacteriaceae archaeon]